MNEKIKCTCRVIPGPQEVSALVAMYSHKREDWPSQWNLPVPGLHGDCPWIWGEADFKLVYKTGRKEDRTQWVGHVDQSGTQATLCLRFSSPHRGQTSACPHTGLRTFLLTCSFGKRTLRDLARLPGSRREVEQQKKRKGIFLT